MLGLLSVILYLLCVNVIDSFKAPGCLVGRFAGKTRPLGMTERYNLDHFKRMIERKKVEVENLLHRHQKEDDPLLMRLNYMATNNK